jgi:hypothetical protein
MYPDLKIRIVKTESVSPRRNFGITCFPIVVFFNINSYLPEAACPWLLWALTCAHFDRGSRT